MTRREKAQRCFELAGYSLTFIAAGFLLPTFLFNWIGSYALLALLFASWRLLRAKVVSD